MTFVALSNHKPRPHCNHLVLCPFGGASRGAFRTWRHISEPMLESVLHVYPGRDHRVLEPCADSVHSLAYEVAKTASAGSFSQCKWILAGHSLGAQVAFEACLLLELWNKPPDALVLSACHAPHMGARRPLSHLDDQSFIQELMDAGGAPHELQTDKEFRDLFLPMLRSDFRAAETYQRQLTEYRPKVSTQTLLIWNAEDGEATREDVEGWTQWTAGERHLTQIAGDHFQLVREPMAFLAPILHHFPVILSRKAPW